MARIMQVGLGRWGGSWAKDIVPSVKTAEPVAFVDSAPAAIARVQKEAGAMPEQCFANHADALAAVECDLVLATLRTEAHFAVVKMALEAGLHVIVE